MDRVNELRQEAEDARADLRVEERALNAILDEQKERRTEYRAFLNKQRDGKLADDEKPKLADAEGELEGVEARLSAQRKLIDAAKAEVDEKTAAAAAEQKRLDEEAAKLVKAPSGRVQVDPPNAEKDPKRGFSDHRDFLTSVMRAGMGRGEDERLRPLATQGSDEQQAAANPYGGYLIPVGVAPGILAVGAEGDPLAPPITRAVPLMAPSVKFNARVDKNHASSVSGGLTVSRKPETVDATASRMQFEQITLQAAAEVGLAYASEEILTDSPQSFVALLQAGFTDEFAANAMNERLNGTGGGERLGVLNSPCLISVAKEAGQAASSIVTENIDKMAARCWRYGQAIWVANHNTRPQLRGLVRVVGTGGSVVPYFRTEGNMETLDGRPIIFTEFAQSVGTVGDLILGVWTEYLEGTYQSEQYAESMHVRFAAVERCFRVYRRTDGAPWWRSALTPLNGDTLSPFVALATRS